MDDWWSAEYVSLPFAPDAVTSSFHIPNIPRNKKVTVWVRAICDTTSSAYSDPVSVIRQDDIFSAVFEGDLARCKQILAEHKDNKQKLLASVDEDGVSLCHWAAWRGNVDILVWLCDNKAPLEVEVNGLKPIHWVCVQQRGSGNSPDVLEDRIVECARVLIERTGCGVDCPTSKGRSLAMLSVQSRLPRLVDYLLAAGANLELKDENEDTVLHWAAYMGDTNLVESLCAKGVNPFVSDKEGHTPLHLATMRGHATTTKFLAIFGRKRLVSMKDRQGKTAVEVAYEKQDQNTIDALMEFVLEDVRNRLVLFYVKNNPEGLNKVDDLAEYFIHNEDDLNKELHKKYQTNLDDPLLYHPDTWASLPLCLELYCALCGSDVVAQKLLSDFKLDTDAPQDLSRDERVSRLDQHLTVIFGQNLAYATTWLHNNFSFEIEQATSAPASWEHKK